MKKLAARRLLDGCMAALALKGMTPVMASEILISSPAEAHAFHDDAPFVFSGQALIVDTSFSTERMISLAQPASIVVGEGVSFSLEGAVSATAAPISAPLEKRGLGELALRGPNSYTSNTLLREGSLRIGGDTPLGGILFTLQQQAGTVLEFEPGLQLRNHVQIMHAQQGDAALPGREGLAEWRVRDGLVWMVSDVTSAVPIRKTGAGTLRMTGAINSVATLYIEGGAVALDGTSGGRMHVGTGARLEGAGAFAGAHVAGGGMVAPGGRGAVATLFTWGDVEFEPGSVYHVNVEPGDAPETGAADLFDIIGRARLNGRVWAEPGDGEWLPEQRYVIVSAQGGFDDSRYAGVDSGLAFLDPELEYDATNVYLTLRRNDLTVGDAGETPEEQEVGDAIDPPAQGDDPVQQPPPGQDSDAGQQPPPGQNHDPAPQPPPGQGSDPAPQPPPTPDSEPPHDSVPPPASEPPPPDPVPPSVPPPSSEPDPGSSSDPPGDSGPDPQHHAGPDPRHDADPDPGNDADPRPDSATPESAALPDISGAGADGQPGAAPVSGAGPAPSDASETATAAPEAFSPLQRTMLGMTPPQARSALRQMTGSWHASVRSFLMEDSRYVRQAILASTAAVNGASASIDPFAPASTNAVASPHGVASSHAIASTHAVASNGMAAGGVRGWAQPFAATGRRAAFDGIDGDRHDTHGLVLGMDAPVAPHWRVGGVVAAREARLRRGNLGEPASASASIGSLDAGVVLHGTRPGLRVTLGLLHAWHRITSRRQVSAGPLQNLLGATVHGRSWQWFMEISPQLRPWAEWLGGWARAGAAASGAFGTAGSSGAPRAPGATGATGGAAGDADSQATPGRHSRWRMGPWLQHAWVRLRMPGFRETGGEAAHRVEPSSMGMHVTTLGWRLQRDREWGAARVGVQADLGWRRVWGDTAVAGAQRFAGQGDVAAGGAPRVFISHGQPLRRDALAVDVTVSATAWRDARLSARYGGLYARGLQDHAAWLSVNWRF